MSFKRNNELMEKAVSLYQAENLTEEQRKTVEELLIRYKDNTYKEHTDRHAFYANIVSDMVNDYGFDDKGLAEKMANDHPTLQQSFMRFVTYFIKNMAEKEYFDGRNQESVELAKKFYAIMQEDGWYLPMI